MKTGMRHSDYIKVLLDKRKSETRLIDPIHEKGEFLTSPPGAATLEEIRILTEYIEQRNLHKLINSLPEAKKPILLKKFFKMKRNQQVTVYLTIQEDAVEITGKVSAVGRDFVQLTNLQDRIWIPYTPIISANIPAGVPNYDNSHQYFIYDNDLKRDLITNFGETVSKRDVLVQQFFEESLMTNLLNMEGMWIKAITKEKTYFGKIVSAAEAGVVLNTGFTQVRIDWSSILLVYSMRLFHRLYMMSKNLLKSIL